MDPTILLPMLRVSVARITTFLPDVQIGTIWVYFLSLAREQLRVLCSKTLGNNPDNMGNIILTLRFMYFVYSFTS